MAYSSSDDVNLESTVLLALSTLQTLGKSTKKSKKSKGVSCKEVAEFLKANYSWVDGDVESQVLTALLSCIKTGLVCILKNNKYLSLGAKPGNIFSNCVTRFSHGPKCCCLSTLECLFKIPRTCCVIKSNEVLISKPKKTPKRKRKVKSKSGTTPKGAKPKKSDTDGKKGILKQDCVQDAQETIGTSKSSMSSDKTISKQKCNYCLQMHPHPKMKKLCKSCYPIGSLNYVPSDRFSPRDEFTALDIF